MDLPCVILDIKSIDPTARVVLKRLGAAFSAVKEDTSTDPDQADLECWIRLGRMRYPIKILLQFVDGLFPLGGLSVEEGLLILRSQNRVALAISKSLHGYVWRVGAIVHRFSHYDAITLREGETVCEYTGP